MLKKIAAALLACAIVAVGYSYDGPALANQSPAAAYCTPVYTVVSHGAVASAPLNQEFAFDSSCPGNPGDFFTDGPLYVSNPSFSGSSYNFTIPQMVWYVIGQRVYTPSVSETVAASVTTYYWLNNANGQWVATNLNVAPNPTSTLGYTVISNGSGITGITVATAASAIFNGVSVSALNQSGTDVSGCWLCYGTLGSSSAGAIRFGNNTSGSGYTAIGAGDGGSVNGIFDSVLGVGNTGTRLLTFDNNGNLGITGSLNVPFLSAAGISGSPNQAVIAAISPSQLLFTNPSSSTVIGGTPIIINSSHSSCSDSGVTQYAIAEFLNGDSPPQSPVVIGCSTNVGDVLQPALEIHGLALTDGTVAENGTSGDIQAGYGLGATLGNGDLGAAETATCGKLILGGTTSGTFDFGCTTASKFTANAPLTSSGTIQGSAFNVAGTAITPCDICDGSSGNVTNNVLAYGAGTALGYDTLGSTNSTLTFGATVLPGNGLSITNSVGGLIDVWDGLGSFGSLGDIRSGHSIGALRSIIGGFATAVAPISANYGDVEGSRSTSTGNLNLGGTSSSCNLDYGVTTASVLTAGCALTTGTHNTCSATSGWPCSFTWSATLSSGAGTATQAVPTSSFCTVTPTITLKISSTNVDVYWVTISSTTLTVHVSDMLGTDSRSITGNGSCSP